MGWQTENAWNSGSEGVLFSMYWPVGGKFFSLWGDALLADNGRQLCLILDQNISNRNKKYV